MKMDILPFIVSGTNVSKSLREICFKEKHKLNVNIYLDVEKEVDVAKYVGVEVNVDTEVDVDVERAI